MTILDDLIAAGLPAVDAVPGETPHFSRLLTLQEELIRDSIVNRPAFLRANARPAAKLIANWSTWTEAQANTWGMANIGQPLIDGRANLPATLTLATTRAAIVQIITILDAMWAMQWAMARMIIALRDDRWDLSE